MPDGSEAGRVGAGRHIGRRPRLTIVLQRPAYGGESELVPRDFLPTEEPDLQAFLSCLDGFVEKAGAIDQLYLADARDVVDREQPLDLDPGACLLPRLAL